MAILNKRRTNGQYFLAELLNKDITCKRIIELSGLTSDELLTLEMGTESQRTFEKILSAYGFIQILERLQADVTKKEALIEILWVLKINQRDEEWYPDYCPPQSDLGNYADKHGV